MVLMRVRYDASGPIILASDFPVFRDNLKAYLEQETEIEIIGYASREQEVIRLLQSSEPKLVVLDLKLEWEALCALLDQTHTTCSDQVKRTALPTSASGPIRPVSISEAHTCEPASRGHLVWRLVLVN